MVRPSGWTNERGVYARVRRPTWPKRAERGVSPARPRRPSCPRWDNGELAVPGSASSGTPTLGSPGRPPTDVDPMSRLARGPGRKGAVPPRYLSPPTAARLGCTLGTGPTARGWYAGLPPRIPARLPRSACQPTGAIMTPTPAESGVGRTGMIRAAMADGPPPPGGRLRARSACPARGAPWVTLPRLSRRPAPTTTRAGKCGLRDEGGRRTCCIAVESSTPPTLLDG